MSEILFQPIEEVFKIKQETVKALNRLEIFNLRDLLFYRPNSFIVKEINPNLSLLKEGQIIQTEIVIQEILLLRKARGPIKILASNNTGAVWLVFFNKIPPFIFNRLVVGSKHIITGKVQFFDFSFQIIHPEFIFSKQIDSPFEPIYPLTYGIVNKQLYGLILQGLEIVEKLIKGDKERKFFIHSSEISNFMIELLKDLSVLHLYKVTAPINEIMKLREISIKKLAQKELFANQASLSLIRLQKKEKKRRNFTKATHLQDLVLKKLDFTLTEAQKMVIAEIEEEQSANIQMMRLLQGDVGSGKTVVAMLTMLNVVNTAHQAVLMVPTDLLANQHFNFFLKALEDLEIKVVLLTGKTSKKERKEINEGLLNGNISILIGTHALFQEKVAFKNLGYIVIDEQHKFGVQQRLNLINKSSNPDVLIMTATPIPRSLTLTMFGDMSISRLKGKPRNRLPILTTTISLSKIKEILLSLNKRLMKDEKIYWVCPLIDQNDKEVTLEEKEEVMDVHSRFNAVDQFYPGKVDILHGKMPSEQKDQIMRKFKNGEKQILIATTVIEVGIDVPEATLIIIENSEKFGLAQLHQLRGRVGRGVLQSYCILIYNPKRMSENAKKRLALMRETNDGFYIAEQDLLLRGSGEIIGKRQSGEPQFFFADLSRDLKLLNDSYEKTLNISMNPFINLQVNLFTKRCNFLGKIT